MKRKICPVSFNLEDPFESELLRKAENKGPFSKYIKRLMMLDQVEAKPVVQMERPRKNRTASSFL